MKIEGDSENEEEESGSRDKNKMNSTSKGLFYSLFSGILASFAGTIGKFALTRNESIWLCESVLHLLYSQFSEEKTYLECHYVALYLQIFFFILMLIVNAFMWTTFVKALKYCNTSLEATITNTAANFFSSAIVGQIIFGETLSLFWWMGTLLIIFGLALMNFSRKGIRLQDIFKSSKKHKLR